MPKPKQSSSISKTTTSKTYDSKYDLNEVIISPYKFKIRYDTDLTGTTDESPTVISNLYGYIDVDKEEIVIDDTITSTVTKTTLAHEIIHGILYRAGFVDHNEHYVDAIAKGFIDLIHTNPDIIEYFKEK